MGVRLPSQDPPPEQVSLAPSFHGVLRKALELQKVQKDTYIGVDHLINTLAEEPSIQAALREANIPKRKDVSTPALGSWSWGLCGTISCPSSSTASARLSFATLLLRARRSQVLRGP